jgi:hypothetical protein
MELVNRRCLGREYFGLEDKRRDSDAGLTFISQLLDGVASSVQGSVRLDPHLGLRLHRVIEDVMNVSSQLVLESSQRLTRRNHRRRKLQASQPLTV